MTRATSLLIAALALLLLTAPVAVTAAYATPITFVASLRGDNEVPPTGSPGTGFATVVLDPAAHTMHVDVAFSGLLGPTTAAHIHCCLPSPLASGVNAIVATTTLRLLDSGSDLGTYLMTDSHWRRATTRLSPAPSMSGTIAGAEAALRAESGTETYLNIHTARRFPGGRSVFLVAPEPVRSCSWCRPAGLSGVTWNGAAVSSRCLDRRCPNGRRVPLGARGVLRVRRPDEV
jgi:hypothetical protein